MAEAKATTQQQDPQAAAQGNGALDIAGIQKIVAESVAAAVKPLADAFKATADNQKVIADTMAADKKAAEDAKAVAAAEKKPATEAKALTAEDVARIVGDSLKQRDAEAQSTAAKNAFIAEKMKDVPKPYLSALGNDPAKWAQEEQQIRDGLKADLAKLGVAPKEVSGGNPGGGTSQQTGTVAAQKSMGNLTPGQQAFADSLVLPTATNPAQAAAK